MYLIGFDIGSSSVKASIIDGASGKCLATSFYPQEEMPIMAHKAGWAEQHPELWWENLKLALADTLKKSGIQGTDVDAIGISYQMHGLVMVDKDHNVIRPSIIWCDSRAAEIGEKAFNKIGREQCLSTMLNSPGNFTASKLKWVKDNEPDLYNKTYKIMLPRAYSAMKRTGEIQTTAGR